MKRLIISIALLLVSSAHAWAEQALSWGGQPSKDLCSLSEGGVWTEYAGGVECLRYFVGGEIDNAPVVIVVLRGDRDTWLKRDPKDIPQNTVSAQTALARSLSEEMGFPVVVLSRPGTYGASGDHRRRRQIEEFLAIDGALDSIRADHRIGRFVLLGHSGGATAGAALLTLGRDDIGCAVLTSGAFGLLERAEVLRESAGRLSRPGVDTTGLPTPYDPLDHLDGVVADQARLIIILGNSHDRVTPFYLQKRFYQGLRFWGHRAQLREAGASAPAYHNLTGKAGPRAAAECAREVAP